MIVLASNSPRRKQLMRLISPSFIIDPADIEESHAENIPLDRMPEFLALQKAQQVQKKHPDDIVIGCDTGVFINNMMIGKPSSDKTAFEILKMLSGKTHRVITGCAIIKGDITLRFSQTTEVLSPKKKWKPTLPPVSRATRQAPTAFRARARCWSRRSAATITMWSDCPLHC